jgi:hypothetical protein
MKKLIYQGILVAVIISLWGCVRSNQGQTPKPNQTLTKALKLMDQGRPEEGAVLLEQMHEKMPENDEVTISLASTYAAMAGIKIVSFYDLFYEILFNRPLVDSQGGSGTQKYRAVLGSSPKKPAARFPDAKAEPQQSLAEVNLGRLRENLVMALQLSELLSKLPAVAEEKEIFLREAIRLLEGLVSPHRAQHGYRSLLRATLFKADLFRRFSDNETTDKCGFSPLELVGHFEEVDRQFSALLIDIAQAYPKERTNLKKTGARFHQVFVSLQNDVQTMGAVNFQSNLQSYVSSTQLDTCGEK